MTPTECSQAEVVVLLFWVSGLLDLFRIPDFVLRMYRVQFHRMAIIGRQFVFFQHLTESLS